jgi:ribulose 1,5-bisphosphate carboxylase large subunit-like protein
MAQRSPSKKDEDFTQDIDMDELDDRIEQLRQSIDELNESRTFSLQYKINITAFCEFRAELLQMIYKFKRNMFADKDIFMKLGQKEADVRTMEDMVK